MKVQRGDLYVGMFLIATVGAVLAALVATSGLGVRRWDLYVQADNVQDIAIDTKVFLQGLEVGRVSRITATETKPGRLAFQIRLSMLTEFSDGKPLRLPHGTQAILEVDILGNATLKLAAGADTSALSAGDTIELQRPPEMLQAVGSLATDLKGDLQQVLLQATNTMRSVQLLTESLTVAAGTARGFMTGIRPGTEQLLADASVNLQRVTRLIDTADVRTGITMRQLDATLAQSRRVMENADSLTRLLTAMGGESRPEIRAIMENTRLLSQQMLFVMEQLSRRPARFMTGMQLPDTLTVDGRARRTAGCPADANRSARDSACVLEPRP